MTGELGTVSPLENLGMHKCRDKLAAEGPLPGSGWVHWALWITDLSSDNPHHTGWRKDGVGVGGVVSWGELVGEYIGLTILRVGMIGYHEIKPPEE